MLRKVPQGKVYGIDYSSDSVAASKKKNARNLGTRCFIEQGNVLAIANEDSMFDLVTAFETVYFWSDLYKAFSEVYRVLKDGGIFTFSYGVADNGAIKYWEKQIDAMNILPIETVADILRRVGFMDIQQTNIGSASINILAHKHQ